MKFVTIIWNITSGLVRLKNITVSSNNASEVVNTVFHLLPSFIHTLLYLYYRSNLVYTFFIPIFSIMSKVKGKK